MEKWNLNYTRNIYFLNILKITLKLTHEVREILFYMKTVLSNVRGGTITFELSFWQL